MLMLLRWIRRARNAVSHQLSPLERLVLDAVRRRSGGLQRVQWERQIAAINRAQRLPDGREVNLYRMRRGRPSFAAEIAFSDKAHEALVGRVELSFGDSAPNLVACVWCVNGLLAAIEYGRRVTPQETFMELAHVSVVRVEVTFGDPVDGDT
jgi:hypothetical protein